jgi:tetratricopeptide (TPR) repeat protein
MTTPWTPCPHAGTLHFDAERLRVQWSRLHRGDAEPLPADAALLEAWVWFHNGEFQRAADAGLRLGGDGLTLANKARCIHASYVEPSEPLRLERLQAAAACAQAQQASDPHNPNAWYWQAYAIGRYSQGISVAKALARGLGSQVQRALERTMALSPEHADAHLALANFHAEVIHKVGELIGGMTYGARKDAGLALYQSAMALNPDSAITLAEFANGLLMLEGDKALDQATALLQRAADFEPLDAMEHLYVDSARMALQG